MDVIDLCHPIEPSMPVYPGTDPPVFQPATTLDSDGFSELRLSLHTHTGTHMDMPAHILAGGATIDDYRADYFIGPAMKIDVSPATEQILTEHLVPYADQLHQCRFVLLQTDWSRFWGNNDYFSGFPTLSKEAAHWLTSFDLHGIGIDAVSVDRVADEALPIHHILLTDGLVLIENLTQLKQLPASTFTFSCLPLPFNSADGSPVRAVAMVPSHDD